MLKIVLESIDHNKQVYETVGDYFLDNDGVTHIVSSEMSSWKYEFLVAFHELIESTLMRERGIPFGDSNKFDIIFEKNRKPGNEDEPGDDPKCPYRKEHFFATNLERMMAHELGIDWSTYDMIVNSLCQTKTKHRTGIKKAI
jgi:hypothetical protein